jgi:hypothetical protein
MPRQVNITDRSHPKEAGCGSMIYKDGGCNHIWSCEQRRRLLLRRRACTAQQPTPPQYHTPAHTLTRVGWVVGVRRQVRVPLVLAVLRPVLCHGQGQEGALPPPRELPLPLLVRGLCVWASMGHVEVASALAAACAECWTFLKIRACSGNHQLCKLQGKTSAYHTDGWYRLRVTIVVIGTQSELAEELPTF